jgi:hypothetical protein
MITSINKHKCQALGIFISSKILRDASGENSYDGAARILAQQIILGA